jgi:hypothetical protein
MKNGFTGVLTSHLVLRCGAILFRIRNVYPDQDIGYPEHDRGRLAQSIWAVYWDNTAPTGSFQVLYNPHVRRE